MERYRLALLLILVGVGLESLTALVATALGEQGTLLESSLVTALAGVIVLAGGGLLLWDLLQ